RGPPFRHAATLRSEALGQGHEVVAAERIPGGRDGVAVTEHGDVAEQAADRRIVVEQVADTDVDQRLLAAEPGGRIRGAQVDVVFTLPIDPAVGRIVLLHLADGTPAADELPRIPGRLPHRREGVLPLRTRASAGAAPEAGALLDLGARDR